MVIWFNNWISSIMLENKWISKVVLFSSLRVSSLLSLKTNESIILFSLNNNYLKKLRLKNNLSKSNQKLRDVITKKYDNQVTFKKWLWKNILYLTFFFIIKKKKIYKKLIRWKKKLNIKLIFLYQEKWENYLLFFYLRGERMRTENERINLCLTFYFFKQKIKKDMQE